MTLVAHTSWQSAVWTVAASHPEWQLPVRAADQCVEASYVLQEELQRAGHVSALYVGERPKSLLPTDFGEHVFIVIDGADVAVDLTGRQFWPACDVPIVEPLPRYAARFTGAVARY